MHTHSRWQRFSITPLTPDPQQNHLKFLKFKPCLTRRQQHPSPSSLKLAYFTPVSWGKWLSHQMASSLDNEPQEHLTVRDSRLRGMALFYGLLLGSPPFSAHTLCLEYLMSVRTLLMMITLGFICPTSTSSQSSRPTYPITYLIFLLRHLTDILTG